MVLIGIPIVFLILIILQRMLYQRLWQHNLSVSLDFSAPAGREGSSVLLTEVVTSRKRLPLPWLAVRFQVSRNLGFPDHLHAVITDYYYREDLFALGLYERLSRTLQVDLYKRGCYTIKSIDLLSSDLLLTTRLVGRAHSPSVLTVTPRLISREALDILFRKLWGTVTVTRSLLADPFEFRTIRDYQSFDTLRSINWLATARTSQLKVNVNEFTATQAVRILLNVEPDSAVVEEELIEEGIRIAASLCTWLVEDGIACALVSNGRDITTGECPDISSGQTTQHVQAVHEQLGRLDLTQEAADFVNLVDNRLADWTHESILLLISLNCSQLLAQTWQHCLDQGYQGLWIVPVYDGQTDRLPPAEIDSFCWPVLRYAPDRTPAS